MPAHDKCDFWRTETPLKGLKIPIHSSHRGFYMNLWFTFYGKYDLIIQTGSYKHKNKSQGVGVLIIRTLLPTLGTPWHWIGTNIFGFQQTELDKEMAIRIAMLGNY